MLSLLTEAPGPGFPADYLRARLAGRRGALAAVAGGAPAKTFPAGGDDRRYWDQAASERSWLFRQLDLELRAALAPLFVFFELGTVARVLRYLAGDMAQDADRVLQGSMLAPMFRSLLRGRDGVLAVLTRLERSPYGLVLTLAGIRESYTAGGLQRCEELLRGRFLARALASARQRDLLFFFRAVVDIRNLLAMAKSLRWGPDPPPVLIPGGQIFLPRSVERVTAAGLARMVRHWTLGLDPTADQLRPEHLEPLLQAHLLRQLRRRCREGSAAAACIEYVWRGYAVAREGSLRLHMAGEIGP